MTLKSNKFVHLRHYTQYSLSRGALRINELISFCKKEQIPAAAISDFNNLFGSLEFCIECSKSGIQPIVGINLLVRHNKFEDGYVLLLCKNKEGYENLVKLVSTAYLENSSSNDPFISLDNLFKFKNGLICLGGGIFGILTKNAIVNKDFSDELINIFKNKFGGNFFLEIQRINDDQSSSLENYILNKSLNLKIPVVATNENFFLNKNFFKTHDTLLSISQQKYLESEDRLKSNINFYLKTTNEMFDLFSDLPEVLQNTLNLARKCSFFLEEKPPSLPKIQTNGINENDMLTETAKNGILKRLGIKKYHEIDKNYKDRLEYELKVIIKMGYSSYFLIVSDFIKWAKNQKIPVGPGRGSGAGSLVAWALFITNLDPLRFGLIFERFLNPERISLPDFDIDFCMDKRDEVIRYVQQKYGELNVAQIITFGSFQARAALRDVGRVLQLPLNLIDDICKMIPNNPANPISLNDFLKDDKSIKKLIKNDFNIQNLFEISSNLEGLLRHASTHAAGIVIAEKPLDRTIPLYKDPKSEIPVTQFSMKFVEKIGLIKFDFLGLKTLTVIDETLKILKKRSVDINIDNIPLDDSVTYSMLRKGLTNGVFQLEGQGMRETIVKIKPDRFEDLIAIVSLYRPGPMDNIPTYINRKQNKEKYTYIHHDLKPILDETYGIMVYQEQVMLIAQKLAGFSLANADLLRRAMGKKIKSEMIAQREAFILGSKKNGIDEEKASKLFEEIAKFAGYGFNKSHAAAYAMIAYQTAYLKSNYPMEFFCASMNCDLNNFEKLSTYCIEVKKLGYEIVNPDVNLSEVNFFVGYKDNIPKCINFGLSAIKNIGESSINELVNERKRNGNFKNLDDLLKRVSNNILNKKVLEALIFSNALASLESNQKFLYENVDKILTYNSNYHKNFNELQTSLFPQSDDIENRLIRSDSNWNVNLKLEKEIDAFGFYLSDHPTSFYKQFYLKKKIYDLDYLNSDELNDSKNKSNSYIAIIKNINERKSKQGKRFCFLTLSDETSVIDAICFSEVLDNLNFDLKNGKIYIFKISKQFMKESHGLLIVDIKEINKFNDFSTYGISLCADELNHQKFKMLLNRSLSGKNKLEFTLVSSDKNILIKSNQKYDVNLEFVNELRKIRGVLDFKKINKNYS